MKQYYIHVIESETDNIIRKTGPYPWPWACYRLRMELEGLDHDHYHVDLVDLPQQHKSENQ